MRHGGFTWCVMLRSWDGRALGSARWRFDVFDGDLWFVGEVHGEVGEVRDGLKLYRELTDADRNGR
jgi:hypothetical protein